MRIPCIRIVIPKLISYATLLTLAMTSFGHEQTSVIRRSQTEGTIKPFQLQQDKHMELLYNLNTVELVEPLLF